VNYSRVISAGRGRAWLKAKTQRKKESTGRAQSQEKGRKWPASRKECTVWDHKVKINRCLFPNIG
jgi:hypothetical protein